MFEAIKQFFKWLKGEPAQSLPGSVTEGPGSVTNMQPIQLLWVKGDKLTKEKYYAVKHSLSLIGRPNGYKNVIEVAEYHNIGRTTAYKVRDSKTWAHFNGDVVKVPVIDKNRKRAPKVKTKTVL